MGKALAFSNLVYKASVFNQNNMFELRRGFYEEPDTENNEKSC